MVLTRRSFLGGALASGVLWRTPAAEGSQLRVGILSDIHVSYPVGDPRARPFGYRSADAYRNALLHFRARGVDAVVLAGDLTDSGMVSELKVVTDIWREVFPDDRLPDGRHVERIVIYGNHELLSWITQTKQLKDDPKKLDAVLAESIHRNPAGEYEKAFGRRYEPIFSVTVRGRVFTCVNWGFEGQFPEYLAAHRDELGLDAGKRFFHIQHPHPQETVYGEYFGRDYMLWAHVDQSLVTKALSCYSKAVAFSGHSHHPLTDPASIWRGAFTSVATGAGCGTSVPSCYAKRKCEYPYANGHHGLLMEVGPDDRVVLERLDFKTLEKIGPDWEIS